MVLLSDITSMWKLVINLSEAVCCVYEVISQLLDCGWSLKRVIGGWSGVAVARLWLEIPRFQLNIPSRPISSVFSFFLSVTAYTSDVDFQIFYFGGRRRCPNRRDPTRLNLSGHWISSLSNLWAIAMMELIRMARYEKTSRPRRCVWCRQSISSTAGPSAR